MSRCAVAAIAAGFTGCENYVADAFGVELTARGNVADHSFKTNVEKVFVCGDMRRGQSLVVWGLREGRDCAAERLFNVTAYVTPRAQDNDNAALGLAAAAGAIGALLITPSLRSQD
mgnify:CR=1 FL=1